QALAQRALSSGPGRTSGGIYVPVADHPIRIGPVPFHLVDQATVVLVLVVCAAVILYFRHARAGIVIRGLSENVDRAQTLGIDSDRLIRLTCAFACLLSRLVAVRAVLTSVPRAFSHSFDPSLLAAGFILGLF